MEKRPNIRRFLMLLIGGHKVSEVICLNCYRRWKAARPVETRLDQLECPSCRCRGYTIETGETAVAEELLQKAREDGEVTWDG